MSENVENLTDATFDEVVNSADQPMVIDFWADWCGPCKQIAPIIDELADEKKGSVRFAKMNADENQSTMIRLGVKALPTLLVFEDGKEVKRVRGAMPKDRMVAELGI